MLSSVAAPMLYYEHQLEICSAKTQIYFSEEIERNNFLGPISLDDKITFGPPLSSDNRGLKAA